MTETSAKREGLGIEPERDVPAIAKTRTGMTRMTYDAAFSFGVGAGLPGSALRLILL